MKRSSDSPLPCPKRQRTASGSTTLSHSSLGDKWRSVGHDFLNAGRKFGSVVCETFGISSSSSSSSSSTLPAHKPSSSSSYSPSSAATPPTSSSPSEAETEEPPHPPPSPPHPGPSEPTRVSTRPSPVPFPTTADTSTYFPEVDRALAKASRSQRKTPRRKHIFANKHRAQIDAARATMREELLKQLYRVRQRKGYSSDFSTFKGLIEKETELQRSLRLRATSLTDWNRRTRASPEDDDTEFLRHAIRKAQATLAEPKPPRPSTPAISDIQFRFRTKDKGLEEKRRRPAPAILSPEDDAQVDALLKKKGFISKYAKEQVSDQDIMRLRPGKWLNDEVINFYGAMVLGRSEAGKENSAKGSKPLDVHYFSTFFWSKLEKEGYEKGRLAKWTKKMDLFSKDAVLIPVNHANIHWTAAAINFRKKRIESYDSMRDDRPEVFKLLRKYLDQEHQNKKKSPFDFTGWQNYTSSETPSQENGFDCGVFTCQFLESVSRGEDRFNFEQKDIPNLRRRMIWEIGNACLRTD
ncbi:Cysteine proteinase [Mycena kentingensis (nom. inval.)]|nr:Cysteine proteinase [Mycena kentingensis (nom. inval.)]